MIGDNSLKRQADRVMMCVVAVVCVWFLKMVNVYAYHLALAFLVFAPYEHTQIHSFRNILV